MKLFLWFLPVGMLGLGLWWLQAVRNAPPAVAFTKVARQRLVSVLRTNGKVEPLDWQEVRVEGEGLVRHVRVALGQPVRRGEILLELDSAEARAALATAEAAVSQAQVEYEVLRSGGRSRELADLAASAEKLQLELNLAQREAQALERLAAKNAATPYEAERARERVAQIRAEIEGLEKRRHALVGRADLASAEAKLKDAQAALSLARRRLELSVLRAPLAGVVYQLDARPGAYVRRGDLAAKIGVLSNVRVRVYVDEPELGGLRLGLPVTISWDALPGTLWQGSVQKLPTQVVPLGSRQVGEVECVISNEDRKLMPSTNVNVEIQIHVSENALALPKEVLRREQGVPGVYLWREQRVVWRPVTLGIASLTHIEVAAGLNEGDEVALATDFPLRDGMPVARK
ncbi:MAG: efflux RND transporter periplasmic adaptor subunit [Bryobacteraceae bacterium]|nr:efflux RND transporter periplasmic adaptor subunit [Bryobacteraceae bacterium]MDW8379545.1 efflux RND transporter periplasmic adaptor subunit [Bryobacterales bacterium]